MKRTVILLLIMIMCLALVPGAVFAESAPKNSEIKSITVKVEYFPGLEITFTNVPMYCAEISIGEAVYGMPASRQVKFFYGKNTTITFNQDVSMTSGASSATRKTVVFNAGKPYKAADFGPLSTIVIVSTNGSYQITNAEEKISFGSSDKVYYLWFVNASIFKTNIEKEGYTATDIRKWDAKLNTIAADYNGDKKPDFIYTLSGRKTGSLKVVSASKLTDKKDEALKAIADKKFDVYEIKTGDKINLAGAFEWYFCIMEVKDGKLRDVYESLDGIDMKTIYKDNTVSGARILENGYPEPFYNGGSYVQFLKPGYYLFAVLPFVSKHYITDVKAKNYHSLIEKSIFKYNAVVLRVVEG